MWDKPQQLNMLSQALFGLSLLLALYGALHYLVRLPAFNLSVVQLETVPLNVNLAQIEAVLDSELKGNFFTADLEDLQRKLETVPWVRSANVRRYIPWQLKVALEEHVVLARWDKTTWVNQQGELFQAQITDKEVAEKHPHFMGPPESAFEVKEMYFAFNQLLMPLNQTISQISLSPRRAWQVRLQNGMLLDLGRKEVRLRLARFVAVYPQSLAAVQGSVNYVDLRYSNGFAVNILGGSMGGGNLRKENLAGRNVADTMKNNRMQQKNILLGKI
jgi:cell division protein FtsQ